MSEITDKDALVNIEKARREIHAVQSKLVNTAHSHDLNETARRLDCLLEGMDIKCISCEALEAERDELKDSMAHLSKLLGNPDNPIKAMLKKYDDDTNDLHKHINKQVAQLKEAQDKIADMKTDYKVVMELLIDKEGELKKLRDVVDKASIVLDTETIEYYAEVGQRELRELEEAIRGLDHC
jgi:chromosome segregation ATPase